MNTNIQAIGMEPGIILQLKHHYVNNNKKL